MEITTQMEKSLPRTEEASCEEARELEAHEVDLIAGGFFNLLRLTLRYAKLRNGSGLSEVA